MKGSVVRRWKVVGKGDPTDCKHVDGWADEATKDAQRCHRCGARRTRAAVWTYQHEVVRNGKRAFITGTARTKAGAQTALTESLALHDKGEQIAPNKATVGAYLTDWLQLVKPRLKAGTFRSYSDICKHRLIPHLGDVKLSGSRPAQIAACYTTLRESGRRDGNGGLSETSIEHTHRCLHAALEHAVRSRLLGRNPADDVVKPKRGDVETRTWSAAELSIRRSRTSVGYEVVEDTPKSRRSVRTIDLDGQTCAVLRRWRKVQVEERLAWGPAWTDSGLLFTREDGTGLHPHQVADAFDAAVKRSKLPRIRYHDLRHTWATIALRAGVSPKIVSDRLGHASVGFTLDTYAQAVPGWQAEAAATVAGLVFGQSATAR